MAGYDCCIGGADIVHISSYKRNVETILKFIFTRGAPKNQCNNFLQFYDVHYLYLFYTSSFVGLVIVAFLIKPEKNFAQS
jgi:hypothetical protein